jgi:hypothetical protein
VFKAAPVGVWTVVIAFSFAGTALSVALRS